MRRAAAALLVGVVLAGCGGEREQASTTSRAAPPRASGTTAADTSDGPRAALDSKLVAALGDSITAGSPLWDPDPDARARLAAPTGMEPDERSQWGYWFERTDPQGRTVRNCGVFGERTDQIALRLERCAAGAASLVLQGGINDIAQGRSVADAGKDLEAMVQAGKAGGRKVALVEVLPWNNGYPDAAPRVDELNALIRAVGRREAVPVLGWFGALEDPAARGRMRAELTIDGDHPSVAGYKRLAGLVKLP
ncbi:MAG: GDSL-type esterase/lipase family protein [Actinomycetota bacterium]|nr:GDSL-type esterase/lipase family protein [Actinomycetota bacterium]